MKIAYIVLAHRNPEQVIRLISKLSTENTSFFVHIDKRSEAKIFQQIMRGLNHLPNIYFLKRYKCYWGHFSIVAATIEGFKEIFSKDVSFDWVILLSGQDYPIKSKIQIEEFLCRNQGKSFMDYFPIPQPEHINPKWPNSGFDRIIYWHFRLFDEPFVFPGKRKLNVYHWKKYPGQPTLKDRIISKIWFSLVSRFSIRRKFLQGFKPFAGSQFWGLSKECAEYVYNFIQQNPRSVNYFKYVDIPDEMLYQTILLNSRFKDDIINENLWYIDWENPNPDYPATMEKKDLENLLKSPKLFARKFDMCRDTEILDMLDQKILNIKHESVK
jgi:Core-2/I-Branching enzyme